jgi:hypothetical protein
MMTPKHHSTGEVNLSESIRDRDRIDPAIWKRPDMRTALAGRDMAMVYRLLQRSGVSQRRIAALTGQSQLHTSLPGIL